MAQVTVLSSPASISNCRGRSPADGAGSRSNTSARSRRRRPVQMKFGHVTRPTKKNRRHVALQRIPSPPEYDTRIGRCHVSGTQHRFALRRNVEGALPPVDANQVASRSTPVALPPGHPPARRSSRRAGRSGTCGPRCRRRRRQILGQFVRRTECRCWSPVRTPHGRAGCRHSWRPFDTEGGHRHAHIVRVTREAPR